MKGVHLFPFDDEGRQMNNDGALENEAGQRSHGKLVKGCDNMICTLLIWCVPRLWRAHTTNLLPVLYNPL